MIVTVFRSRPTADPQIQEEYKLLSLQLNEIAQTMPGYISLKRFTADDGEHCIIVEFESETAHRAWVNHPAHQQAMQVGREKFLAEYNIKVCELQYVLAKP